MNKHLNYFFPYEHKDSYHEDQLTRAFLVILRMVPLAHSVWLELVDHGHRNRGGDGIDSIQNLPKPEFDLQVSTVPHDVSRIVSAIQTDELFSEVTDAEQSKRVQRLDFIVSYQPDLAIVVENKPDVDDVWSNQLNINLGDSEAKLDSHIASISWRDIIKAWSNLLSKGYLSGAEKLLVQDFLEFLSLNFPRLYPYNKLKLCNKNETPINLRCKAILDEICPNKVHYHTGWNWAIDLGYNRAVKEIALATERYSEFDLTIELLLNPADTMSQAREFYKKLNIDKLIELEKKGWEIRTNFHAAIFAKNLVWITPALSVKDYMSFWKENISTLEQIDKKDYEEFYKYLISNELASKEDLDKLKKEFSDTNRDKLNPCPGIGIKFFWKIEYAEELDDKDKFAANVREHIEEVLSTWGENISECN